MQYSNVCVALLTKAGLSFTRASLTRILNDSSLAHVVDFLITLI